MFVDVKFRCKICGLTGHGQATLTPDQGAREIEPPLGWHVEAKDQEYVAHCSMRCLYHTDRTIPRFKRAETEN